MPKGDSAAQRPCDSQAAGRVPNDCALAPAAGGLVALNAQALSKTFGDSRVLASVDLTVREGEIRGLVGQNGSGKSTLVKILSGYHTPDPGGRLSIRGQSVALPAAPDLVERHGLTVMHQDLGLDPGMSIVDNFAFARQVRRRLRRIRWGVERRRVEHALGRFGLDVDVNGPVGELTGAQRAVVALARTFDRLADSIGVVVLDEPTAALERDSVALLYDALETVRRQGCGVVLISHDLAEVRAVCQTVTVLREGRVVADGAIADLDEEALIEALIGRSLGELYPPERRIRPRPTLLQARGLVGRTIRDVDLDLGEGEVLGVTGLAAMGQDELAELLYGSMQLRKGTLTFLGADYDPTPRASLQRGIAFVPLERRTRGALASATVRENMTLPVASRYYRRWHMSVGDERRDIGRALANFEVRPEDPEHLYGQLSGGNQQKVLLSKWLEVFGTARMLVLNEPTQGVDIGARQTIFRLVREAATADVAIMYISVDHDELARLCDRVIVMRYGRITAEVCSPGITSDQLAVLCMSDESARSSGRQRGC